MTDGEASQQHEPDWQIVEGKPECYLCKARPNTPEDQQEHF